MLRSLLQVGFGCPVTHETQNIWSTIVLSISHSVYTRDDATNTVLVLSAALSVYGKCVNL